MDGAKTAVKLQPDAPAHAAREDDIFGRMSTNHTDGVILNREALLDAERFPRRRPGRFEPVTTAAGTRMALVARSAGPWRRDIQAPLGPLPPLAFQESESRRWKR